MLHSFTASFFRVSLFMASNSKPQRLYQIAGSNVQASAVKKARTMATESAIKARFTKYVEYLNDINEKRERVVKASRDVTMNSKKVIFQVHRMSKYNKEEVLQKAEKDLAAVTDQYMSLLVKELQGTDFWKLRRAYLPGYVEATTFCGFCKNGMLLTFDEINNTLLPLSDLSLQPLQINIIDYLLGLADLIGELMHLTIGRISDSELEFAQMICIFARHIYRVLTFVVPHMDDSHDMKTKLEIMLQSVMKIENEMCFGVLDKKHEKSPILVILLNCDENCSLLPLS
ncbi:hypothetical protein AAHE18_02G082000 [Arachis hypogaea]